MREITIALPLPPGVNAWKTPIVRGGRATMIETDAFRSWKTSAVALLQKHAGLAFIARGSVTVTVEVFRPRKAGDVDGYLKALLDGLGGWMWMDDAVIRGLKITRFESPGQGAIVVRVRDRPAGTMIKPRLKAPPEMLEEAMIETTRLGVRRAVKAKARTEKKARFVDFNVAIAPLRAPLDETPAQRVKRLASSASYPRKS